MNKFHISNYKIYDSRVKNDYRILVMSDLHYNFNTSAIKLNKILKKVKNVMPDYIFFPGDFLDYKDVFYDKNRFINLKMWLKQLASIAPVFITLGNHEYYEINVTNKDSFLKEYVDSLSKIKGVYTLNNSTFNDVRINVTGLTLSFDYYCITEKNKYRENKDILVKEFKLLNKSVLYDNTKINILLVHSPLFLGDKDMNTLLKGYDYVISGHMHNGCVPPIIYELWKSTRGIIAPSKKLFPKYARNTLKEKGDKLIVNGPLTMFSKDIFILKLLNKLFPMYITIMDFTGAPSYDSKKINIINKYEK